MVVDGNANIKKYMPVIIGSVIFLEACLTGPICGVSMNPARSIAPAIFSGNIAPLWIYITAPVTGALFAVSSYRLYRFRIGNYL